MKTMKQAMALLLAIVMVLSLSVNVFAEGESGTMGIVMTPSTTSPSLNEEFTVNVSVTNNPGFNALGTKITYDESVVEFLGFEVEYDEEEEEWVPMSDFSGTIVYNDANGKFAFSRTKNITKTGSLFTVKFKAIAEGNANISYAVGTETYVGSVDVEDVPFTIDDSAVKNLIITEALPDGYVVSLKQDAESKVVGETAQVSLSVSNKEDVKFNTLYVELTYDSDYLTLESESDDTYTIEDNDGLVKIIAYGAEKELGDALTLNFTVKDASAEGTTVTLTKANVDISEHAVANDAPEASLGTKEVTFTAGKYMVTLPEDFSGENTVDAGEDYTFTAKDRNYIYTISATMGGEEAEVIDNEDGSYTIEAVSGNLIITATKVGKSYGVSVEGANEGQVVYENTATYGTDYSFTVNAVEGHATSVAVAIADAAYSNLISDSNGNYTISGADIKGNIKITVTNTPSDYQWTFVGEGATALQDTLSHGQDFAFTVKKDEGYSYIITATMGGKEVTVEPGENDSYIIRNVSGNLVITIDKVANFVPVIKDYVKVDNGTIAQMVAVPVENLTEGKTLKYNGEDMYWSDQYEAFVYLKLVTDLMVVDEENPITIVDGERIVIDYSGDVNGTESIDVNDAQLVYDIYNVKYTDFSVVSMYKFLCADVSGDMEINVSDAAAIVNTIKSAN